MARTPHPRLRAALARQAERTAEAAALMRASAELDPDARRRLADLLDLAGQAAIREGLNVHVNDAREVTEQTGHGWRGSRCGRPQRHM